MAAPIVSRPSGVDVSVNNPRDTIYFPGSEGADGSLRLIPDSTGQLMEVQLRASGVWNDTGIQIAASTVHLGMELLLSAAGSYLYTRDVAEAIKGLTPRILFTTSEGTAGNYAQVPKLDGLITNVDIQGDQTSESTKTDHTYVWTGAGDEFTFRMHVEMGTVAASDNVTLTLYRGSDDTGAIFFQRNYPAADFPSGARVSKTLGGLPETFEGQNIFIKYESPVAFALKGDALGNMYVAHCYHDVTEENIVTLETGLDNVITSFVNKDAMVDVNGNLTSLGAPC